MITCANRCAGPHHSRLEISSPNGSDPELNALGARVHELEGAKITGPAEPLQPNAAASAASAFVPPGRIGMSKKPRRQLSLL
jgi:hypothetical protein